MTKNYQILRQTLDNVISNSSLDVGGIYFVVKDVFRDVENLYFSKINEEIIEDSKKENIKKEENPCE